MRSHLTAVRPLAGLLFLIGWTATTSAQSADPAWSVAVLDKLLASLPAGATLATVGDMQIRVTALRAWRDRLAGVPGPLLAFDGTAATWPGGKVSYTMDASVSPAKERAWLDAAKEWALFANLQFIARSTQANYVTVMENPSLGGGLSAVGMVGGQQFLQIGPNAWNRATLVHETGHTLGLVHEHQRSDRGAYVTILTNNILPGHQPDFVLLTDSRNQSAYDFLSVMHYARAAFSINPATLDTIEPLPPYSQFINVMGAQFDPVLSAADRSGMAAIYGPAPPLTNVVTSTQDNGPGTLRAALYYAYDHPGATIRFNLSPADAGFSNRVFNIQPTDQLPSLVHATVLDGGSQPTNANAPGPAILLDGSAAPVPGTYANGLRLAGANCVVRGFVINGFSADGILLTGSDASGNVVQGCYLGVDSTGAYAATNGDVPLAITAGAHDNTIGGPSAAARNVIAGSAYQGVVIEDAGTLRNRIQGNFIGLSAAGTAALPNAWSGVAIFGGAQSNLVGGTVAGAGNVISGNGDQGVAISDPGTSGNVIAGNLIGLNPGGTAALPNGWSGVGIFGGAPSNLVGGALPAARNVISGNGDQGVTISDSGTVGNVVAGNFIGLDPSGTVAIANGWSGVELWGGAVSNLIGGVAGNVISGNGDDGVRLSGVGTAGTVIQGNIIGLDATGSVAIGNGWSGVEINGGAENALVGGTGPGAGNVLSGNTFHGLVIIGANATGAVAERNLIGLDATGSVAVGNGYSGVGIYHGAGGNLIGGGPGARNIISGNGNYGIFISDPGTTANVIQGNTIGLDAASSQAVPNTWAGVAIYGGTQSNLVGGLTPGTGNLVASNLSGGILLYDAASSGNTVRANSLFGNAYVGLALYSGANATSAAPVLVSAVVTTNTTVSGSLASLAGVQFHLDFYASPPPAFSAQGRTWLGFADVATGAGGSVSFAVNLAGVVPLGHVVTATATDPAGNTSPPSSPAVATATDSVGDGIPDAWRRAHFGGSGTTTNGLSCAACDPDHDGLNNYQEFLAGTDPTNPASALRISSIAPTGADLTLGFQSAPGVTYQIQTRDDLGLGAWALLTDGLLGAGGFLQVTNPGAVLAPRGFYRLVVAP